MTISAAADRLEAALTRIADPALEGETVFTDTFAESARAEATASDQRNAAGASHGPLDGRIVSVKALCDIAGLPTTAGTSVLRGQPPATRDAVAVERLKIAGGVVVGRTVMTEFAFSAVGLNPHDGTPGNPYDRTRIAGGSSTGAAISVAAGMAEIALGSDTGGSIRIPAALCGVTGFKPTSGQAPLDGVFPLSPTLDTLGPIARTVRDCADTFAILKGASPTDLASLAPSDIRITRLSGRLVDDAEPVVAAALDAAFATLSARGVNVMSGNIEAELDLMATLDGIGFFPAVELAATLKMLGFTSLDGIDPRTAAYHGWPEHACRGLSCHAGASSCGHCNDGCSAGFGRNSRPADRPHHCDQDRRCRGPCRIPPGERSTSQKHPRRQPLRSAGDFTTGRQHRSACRPHVDGRTRARRPITRGCGKRRRFAGYVD